MFQLIVNTYGVPTFGEANPAVFTVVSFPFLFGVMFGDIGHGLLLLGAAGFLCWFADSLKKVDDSSLQLAVWMRYLLLMMGFFATYMGFIYNDFMSIPLHLFGDGCYTV